MQRVDVVSTVGFRNVAISIGKVPLSTRGAGVIARRGRGIHAKLRHQPAANVVVMKIAAHAELRHLDFIRPEYFARSADGVIFGMVEIVNVIDVCPEFRRKEF